MIVTPGATSVSLTVQVVDDDGLAVTGLVAATFPSVYYSRAGETLPAAVTLSDLAAQNSAYSSGGVKELAGGCYRFDAPDAAFATASRVKIFGEASGKHLLHPVVTVAHVSSNVAQFGGTAGTFSGGRPEVNVSHVAGTAQTARDLGNALPAAAPNADGGLPILSSSGTTLAYTVSTLTTYTGNTPQTGDSFARLTGTGAVTLASLTVSGATTLTGALTATNASNNVSGIDVAKISGDSVAADNAEAFFDGTGYAGTNNVIPTVTTLTNLPAITAGWLTAAGIASDAITSAKIADDAITDAKIAVPTEASGTPSRILQMILWIAGQLGWRKVVKNSSAGTIVQYMSDGSTVKTTSTFTSSGGVDTLNKSS